MPVNMDPKKRRHGPPAGARHEPQQTEESKHKPEDPFSETEQDREKALADAESKNLWDATEVIDMDTW